MKHFLSATFLLVCTCVFGQATDGPAVPSQTAPKATIDMYRIITLERDTTYVDTSLTIQSEYRFNYLRKDIFGLMPFPNEGQTYNTLYFGRKDISALPHSGRRAKHFNYLTAEQIRYYSVATPLTELYFKTVMEQGQNLDAFLTLNTSENLNFSIAYKGLRSLGKYINQLSSTGNLRFTTSYKTTNRRYIANFHFAGQDILNGENGGLTNPIDFESGNPDFDNRARLEVYNRDAESFLEGKRLFLNHSFRLIGTDDNGISIHHRFDHEYKFFEYRQPTIASTVTTDAGTSSVLRFGDSFVSSNLRDRSRYNHLRNRAGISYSSGLLGNFTFFAEDFRYNYFYDRTLVFPDGIIPGSTHDEIQGIGGSYEYRKNKLRLVGNLQQGVAGRHYSDLRADATYTFDDRNVIRASYGNLNKIPDLTFNLHQSRFQAYNWFNNFKNEKINFLKAEAQTQWLTVALDAYTLKDHLFFSDDNPSVSQEISPKQYDKTIGYLAVKVSKEFRYWKLALDNTVLYQKVTQDDNILNVPELTTRNTLYFSDYFFKRALYVQAGITMNYFSEYFMDAYNPVLGEFFIQEDRKFGNFPMFDFFINGRVRQTRIFIKAEHFNALFTDNKYYSAPEVPYRDFTLRFGLVWNFFQ